MAHAWNRSFINSGSNPPPPGVDFGVPPPHGNPVFPSGTTFPASADPVFPPGFSTDSVDSNKNGQSTSGDKDFVSVAEQLFPPGKMADLQEKFWSDPTQMYIGLEYFIEIQHNTLKKMANHYTCLLCDVDIVLKKTKGKVDTMELAKNHLKSSQHKLKYLIKHFPIIKRIHLKSGKADNDTINAIVDRILPRFAHTPMKIKIVVGQKLFQRKSQEIKKIIENSTHFQEDQPLIEELCGNAAKTIRIDAFDDIFQELEKESKHVENKSGRRARSPSHAEKSTSSFKTARRLDEIPLEGINPLNEPPPPSAVASVLPGSSTSVSAVVGISGVSPPHSSTQDSVPIIIEDDSPPPKRSKGQQMQQEKPYDEKKGQQKSHSKSRSPGGGGGGSRAKYSSYESSQKSHSQSRSPRTSRNKTSRSPSSKTSSRKRRHSSNSASSISSISSSIGEKEKEDRLQKANAELDALVEEFLNEEKKLVDKFDVDKKHYLDFPDQHREYTSEWNYFYKKRCNDEGTNLHPSMIKIDFEEHWKKFITTEYRKLRDGEGSRLMRRYGISDRDIKDFHLRRRRKEKEKQNTSGSGFEDPEQVTVTNTCQRLFAIEQLLEELGTKPAVFMAKSKSLEKRLGNAKLMLDDQDFVDYIHDSKELLKKNLQVGKIPEQFGKAVRTVVDNIEVLLQRTTKKPKSDLDINTSKYQEPLKIQIAETIIAHFKDLNRQLTQNDLDGLVTSEYTRIQDLRSQQGFPVRPHHHIPPAAPPPHAGNPHAQQLMHAGNPHAQQLTHAGNPHAQQLPTQSYQQAQINQFNIPQQSQGPPPPSSSSVSNLNWDLLSSAVKNASSGPGTSTHTIAPEQSHTQAYPTMSKYSEPQKFPVVSARVASPPPPSSHDNLNDGTEEQFEDLTIEELTSLFKSFKDLEPDIRTQLMKYMKKLEKTNPKKVTEMRNMMKHSKK